MLELRPNCECCDCNLSPDSTEARICSFECTFCALCDESKFYGVCPNCCGELLPRPRRTASALANNPASTKRILKQHHIKDFDLMPMNEMFVRRNHTEKLVAGYIGQLVFSYSRLVTSLHLCVAWHNEGKELDSYSSKAEDFAAADLIKKIENQAHVKFIDKPEGLMKYKQWASEAHQLRQERNTIMHSRWGIEAFGRHAIAVTTPVFVEPIKEREFTSKQLRELCNKCEQLNTELNKLRKEYPL